MSPDKGKILIIDDDPDVLETMQMVLSMKGYETVTASTKTAAMALAPKLGDMGVGAVLIDGNLSSTSRGGVDGTEVNETIKNIWGETIRTGGISATDPVVGADIEVMTFGEPQTFLAELEQL